MELPPGNHTVDLGPLLPGFLHRVDVAVNGDAAVWAYAAGGRLYLAVSSGDPLSLSFSLLYVPALPLAVALYLALTREPALRRLLGFAALLYPRLLSAGEVLGNVRRREVYRLVKERGYVWPRQLERELGLAYGEVQWHLLLLQRAGLIYSLAALRRRFYVDSAVEPEAALRRIYREVAGREPTAEELRAALARLR